MKKKSCSQIYSIESINLNGNKGCAKLNSLDPSKPVQQLSLVWEITEYPMEHPGMPGSPYTVKVDFTIFDKINYSNDLLIGQIIYQINSGTLVKYSELGIPYSTYMFVLDSGRDNSKFKVGLFLTEDSSKIIVTNWI